jgi:Protein of unknown function (DUF3617)
MKRLGLILLCALPVLTLPAAADNLIEPGQWKVTSNTVMNGAAMQPAVKARCLTAEQVGDIAKTFGPSSGTVNSTCEPAELETAGRKLKWHLRCRGQMDMDVLGNFDFDSPVHYTATVTSKAWMAGSLMSDVKTELEGERVSACQP